MNVILRLIKVSFCVFLFFINTSSLYAQPFAWTQLSASGATPSPLDFRVGQYGDIQIWRDGNADGQLYDPTGDANGVTGWSMYNGPFMTIGNQTVVSWNWGISGYNDYWIGGVSAVSGTGTVIDPWVIEADYQNSGLNGYGFNMRYKYVNGTEYIDVEMTPFAPNGNTNEIKVYHLMDTYLSSSDHGAAYTIGTAPYNLVGVAAASGVLFEAFVVTSDPWDRYASEDYYDLLNSPWGNGELSNNLDTDPTTDNAMGVQWTLGVVTGVQPTIGYRIGFTNDVSTIISCGKSYINRHIARKIKVSN